MFGALSSVRKTLGVTGKKSQMGINLQREGYNFQVKRIISMLAGGRARRMLSQTDGSHQGDVKDNSRLCTLWLVMGEETGAHKMNIHRSGDEHSLSKVGEPRTPSIPHTSSRLHGFQSILSIKPAVASGGPGSLGPT